MFTYDKPLLLLWQNSCCCFSLGESSCILTFGCKTKVQVEEEKDVLFCILVEFGGFFFFLCLREIFLTSVHPYPLFMPLLYVWSVWTAPFVSSKGWSSPPPTENKPYFSSITPASFKNPCQAHTEYKMKGECVATQYPRVLFPKQMLVSLRVKTQRTKKPEFSMHDSSFILNGPNVTLVNLEKLLIS